ncbi:MAG TPA: hypothetical protein VGO96_00030 [Pyrinomonadaceae bacterium]|nr:hypothetical protein [Pyrinomonadaceae bacterium]
MNWIQRGENYLYRIPAGNARKIFQPAHRAVESRPRILPAPDKKDERLSDPYRIAQPFFLLYVGRELVSLVQPALWLCVVKEAIRC